MKVFKSRSCPRLESALSCFSLGKVPLPWLPAALLQPATTRLQRRKIRLYFCLISRQWKLFGGCQSCKVLESLLNFWWFLQFATAQVSLAHIEPVCSLVKQPPATPSSGGGRLAHCLSSSWSQRDWSETGLKPAFPMWDQEDKQAPSWFSSRALGDAQFLPRVAVLL